MSVSCYAEKSVTNSDLQAVDIYTEGKKLRREYKSIRYWKIILCTKQRFVQPSCTKKKKVINLCNIISSGGERELNILQSAKSEDPTELKWMLFSSWVTLRLFGKERVKLSKSLIN
jgi:hypothetical protein